MTASSLRFFVLGCVALLSASALHAQTPAPTAEQLKSWVAIRQQRVDLLRDEVKQTDARLESRLDLIVDALKTITDSKDSKTKVARMKEDTGKRLMKTIGYYDQKRAALKEELRSPRLNLTAAEKQKMIAAFDAKIEKRTRQILELNKAMPAPEDYDRYRTTVDESRRGRRTDIDFERNPDFEQNRRMTSHSNTQREAIIKQLDASIARLDRQSRTLKTQLAAATDPLQRKTLTEELAKTDRIIAARRQQRTETQEPPNVAMKSVDQKEALDMDQALQNSINELRRDFTTLFERYNTLLSELSTLHATEAALAAQGRR